MRKLSNGGVKITANNEEYENLDELFQKILDLIGKIDPRLLEDISRAASEDCRDLDFIVAVAVRINMIAPLLDFSEESPLYPDFSKKIQKYLKTIQMGLLYKGSELYPKGLAPYLNPYITETTVYSEEA